MEALVMPDATTASQPDLLQYLPAYRVLICKECRYAIQPSAISRHLKDLHHIYRSDRSELLEYTKKLDLAEPGDVLLPPPDKAPIALLPTESGLACEREGCTHLCVTVKRMKNHWATAHRDIVGSTHSQWRPVTLQTFFRGNQLRYFIVTEPSIPSPSSTQVSQLQSEPDSRTPETTASSCSESCKAEPTFPPDWSASDIALFNNFRETTYHDLSQAPTSRHIWKTPVPFMAFTHPFLKHGILACSALHLAYLHPSQKHHWQLVAAQHQSLALPLYREVVGHVTEENCNALLAFSHLLIVHCFAAEAADEDFVFVKNPCLAPCSGSGLPDWFQVIRSSCGMFESVWSQLKTGIMKPIIEEGLRNEEALPIIPSDPAHAARLKSLLTLPILGSNPEVGQVFSEKMTAYSSALILLSRGFVRAEAAKKHGAFTTWTAVDIWPARISDEFLEQLRRREPAALVLLAHYCALLGPLEASWYMVGFRKRLLERIWWQLEGEWRVWLEWPFQESGLAMPDEGVMEGVRFEGQGCEVND